MAPPGPRPDIPPRPSEQRDRRRPVVQPGEVFGRYEIEALLGQGGMGRVYRARDTRLGRRVALKVIYLAEGDAKQELRAQRLLREARAAAALDHPSTVAVFDADEIDDMVFIAMELVTGRPLRQYLSSKQPGWEVRLRWLVELASALAVVHERGIVHRDVKPENVMITGDGRVKLLDFGIARHAAGLPAETSTPAITEEGVALGTPRYMSPEQLRAGPMDGRSDQFSWGVLAYELLSGVHPWGGDSLQVVLAIAYDPPALLRDRMSDIPPDVEAIVMRTLEKKPCDRFASMAEVVLALEPFAARPGRLLPALPDAMEERAGEERATESMPIRAQLDAVGAAPSSGDAGSGLQRPTGLSERFVGVQRTLTIPWTAAQEAGGDPGARRRRIGLMGAALLLIALAGVFVSFRLRDRPVAVTDLPTPMSTSKAALAAYRSGLADIRLDSAATAAFELAVKLDPEFAAAHLQLAVAACAYQIDDEARAHFRMADARRQDLSLRDQALLDAIEPALHQQPSDWDEAIRRLSAALEHFPRDAQLWLELGFFTQIKGDLEGSNLLLDRALAEDPGFASALGTKAQSLAYRGRFEEARATLATCKQVARAAGECLRTEASLMVHAGACEALESTARQMIAGGQPGSGYQYLAASLAAQGKPATGVRAALQQSTKTYPEPIRREIDLWNEAYVAMWTGDFEAAERAARTLADGVEGRTRWDEHAAVALLLVQILQETGRVDEAGRIADERLARRDAWEPDPRVDDVAIASDATPRLLAAALRAGRIGPDDFTAQRAAWVQQWQRVTAFQTSDFIWLHGYGALADSPERAREAREALPRFGKIPPFRPGTLVTAIGPMYLLTGDADLAVIWLEDVTASCEMLQYPIDHTQAYAWLGRAREVNGDMDGACAAYRAVLRRWGAAKPTSVTASSAREQMDALACAP